MTKEELEKEAAAYALEWGDKTDGTYACCKDGYLAGAEPRENQISELKAYNEKLLNGDIEKHNKIVELEKACHKWFMRWREAKKDALYFDSRLQEQIEATYKVVEELNKAKEIISKFLNAKSIEETCVAESEAEKFIKE